MFIYAICHNINVECTVRIVLVNLATLAVLHAHTMKARRIRISQLSQGTDNNNAKYLLQKNELYVRLLFFDHHQRKNKGHSRNVRSFMAKSNLAAPFLCVLFCRNFPFLSWYVRLRSIIVLYIRVLRLFG